MRYTDDDAMSAHFKEPPQSKLCAVRGVETMFYRDDDAGWFAKVFRKGGKWAVIWFDTWRVTSHDSESDAVKEVMDFWMFGKPQGEHK